jgi:hypothetical protein
MTTVRRSFNVGGRKTITPTNILSLALCLTICLSMALHTSLYAPVYDLRNRSSSDMTDRWNSMLNKYNVRYLDESEYKAQGGKVFRIVNNTGHEVYIRIGYEACEFTGLQIEGGYYVKEGSIYKAPGCIPINVTGYYYKDGKPIAIPNDIRGRRMDQLGELYWLVFADKIVGPARWDNEGYKMDGVLLDGNGNKMTREWVSK